MIKKVKEGFKIISHKDYHGIFKTRKAAEKRLKQIKRFNRQK